MTPTHLEFDTSSVAADSSSPSNNSIRQIVLARQIKDLTSKIPYSLMASIERAAVGNVYVQPAGTQVSLACIPLVITTRHFLQLTIYLPAGTAQGQQSASKLMDSLEHLLTQSYIPHGQYASFLLPAIDFILSKSKEVQVVSSMAEDKSAMEETLFGGRVSVSESKDQRLWSDYERMGVGLSWRFTDSNKDYSLCSTYPRLLVVPQRISDTVLFHAAKHRSRNRFPALTYLHSSNQASITRSSQPMVGIKAKRSLQDEKLLEAIFQANRPPQQTPSPLNSSEKLGFKNIIIDARPMGNAMANRAMGAGTESTEHYKDCDRLFMNIENIHIMRDSITKLIDAFKNSDANMPVDKWFSLVESSKWLKHIRAILDATVLIVDAIEVGENVLIHCSDGWDRTAQLSSLASLCLDPHYRTWDGFQTILEREWVTFGHKFSERCGHHIPPTIGWASKKSRISSSTNSSKDEKETSPVFLQFLECTAHLMRLYPTAFEFNSTILLDLHAFSHSCIFGTFLFKNEQERTDAFNSVIKKTTQLWEYMDKAKSFYNNIIYVPTKDVLHASAAHQDLIVWHELYSRYDSDLMGTGSFLPTEGQNQRPVAAYDSMQVALERLRRLALSKNQTPTQNQSPSSVIDNDDWWNKFSNAEAQDKPSPILECVKLVYEHHGLSHLLL